MSDPQEQTPWDQINAEIERVVYAPGHQRGLREMIAAAHAADHAALQRLQMEVVNLRSAFGFEQEKNRQAEAAVQRLQQALAQAQQEREQTMPCLVSALFRIVEGGLRGDAEKVRSYADHIVQYLPVDSGERLRRALADGFGRVVILAASPEARLQSSTPQESK